ncbi:hypothetical protein GQ457_01G014310 [Hibiscus cannabinus]
MLEFQSQCCSNPPTLDAARGGGHVENIAGFDTYVSGSLESKLALLLVIDGFEEVHLLIFKWPAPRMNND